jgi:hypothetical protein
MSVRQPELKLPVRSLSLKKDVSMKALMSNRFALSIAFAILGTAVSAACLAGSVSAAPAPSPLVSNMPIKWLQVVASQHLRQTEGKKVDDYIKGPLAAARTVPTAEHPNAANNPITVTSIVQTDDFTHPFETGTTDTPMNLDPSWDPSEDYFYFSSNASSDHLFHLYAMASTGAVTPIQMTTDSFNERWPVVINQNIVFCQSVGGDPNGPYSLVIAQLKPTDLGPVVNATTEAVLVSAENLGLPGNLDCEHPSYTGDLIAFAGRPATNEVYHIYTTSTSGATVDQLTGGAADEENPSMNPSPSGQPQLIAFDSTATGYSFSQSGVPPLSSTGTQAARNIFVIEPNGSNPTGSTTITPITAAAGLDNCDPAFGFVPTTIETSAELPNILPSAFYIWFSSDRAASGKFGIWYLNVGNPRANGTWTPTVESGGNPATPLITSDPTGPGEPIGGYNNFEPAVPLFLNHNTVLYVTPRFLVNNSTDNPLVNAFAHGAPAFPTPDNEPVNTPTSPAGAFSPLNTEQLPLTGLNGMELFGSQMLDLDPPALLRYSTSEIVHVEAYTPGETSPGATERTFTAGTSVKFVVRLSERQTGVGQVYIELKNPNSRYQQAANLEHKVYTKDPNATNPNTGALLHPVLTSDPYSPFGTATNEATELWSTGGRGGYTGSPMIMGYNSTGALTTPVYGGVMKTVVPPEYAGLGYSTSKNVLTGYGGGPFSVPGMPTAAAAGQAVPSGGGVAIMPTIMNRSEITQISVKGINAIEPINPGNNNGAGDYLVTGDVLDLYDYLGDFVEEVQCVGCGPVSATATDPVTATLYVTQVLNSYAVPTGYTTTPAAQPGYVVVARIGYFDFQGVEVDCQDLVAFAADAVSAPEDFGFEPGDYVTPPYTPGVDDQPVLSGNGTEPPTDPTGNQLWIPLTPLPSTDPDYDTNGGVLYSGTWTTPQLQSDWYMDVIAYDNAVTFNQNWRIYDNVWGFSTKPFTSTTSPGGILMVNDYMLPQKFFGAGFAVDNPVNIPPNFYGAESYLTDIDTSYDDNAGGQNAQGGVGQLASLPQAAWTDLETGTSITEFMTLLYHQASDDDDGYAPYYPNTLGPNSYTDYRQNGVTTPYALPAFPLYPPVEHRGRASVADGYLYGNTDSNDTGVTNAPSQDYDIWRILSRGPVPTDVLDLYAPKIQTQPADVVNGAKTGLNVLTASSCVLWASPFAGDEFADNGTIVDPNTQAELTSFVNAGGRLFVEGMNVGFALTQAGTLKATPPSNPNGTTFYNSVLDADYVREDIIPSVGSVTFTGATNQTDYISHDAAINNDNANYPPNAHPSEPDFKLANLESAPIGVAPNWTYWPPSEGTLELAQDNRNLNATTNSVTDASLDDGGTLEQAGAGFIDGFSNAIATQPPGVGPITTFPVEKSELVATGLAAPNNTDQLEYTMMAPPTGVNENNGIVAYSSFGLESVAQVIAPLTSAPFIPDLNNGTPLLPDIPVWSLEAQRTDLMQNLISFLRTGTLQGQVTQNGSAGVSPGPVPYAEVRATPAGFGGYNDPTQVYTAIADVNGNYSIQGVPPGRWDISGYAPGTSFQHVTFALADVHGGDAATTPISLSSGNPGSLIVTVKGAVSGDFIAGATVTAVAQPVTPVSPSYEELTNSSGVADFSDVTAAVYLVTATATGFGSGSATVTVVAPNPTDVTILLSAAPSTVNGTVTDATTHLPIDGAAVTLAPTFTGTTFTGVTGVGGTYSIAKVVPGTYTVSCAAATYTTQSVPETVPSNTTVTYNFALTKAPTGTVYGLVSRQSGGVPVNPATITLTDQLNPSNVITIATGATTFTGPDGATANFEKTGVPYSTYTVSVTANGYPPVSSQTLTLDSPSARVNFVMPSLHEFGTGLQFFSVPYTYTGPTAFSLSQIFGYTDPILAVWQPSVSTYALTPTPPANSLVAGTGYWVRFPSTAGGLLLAGTPEPTTPGSVVKVLLPAGWNQIGNPYQIGVQISNLLFLDGSGNTYTFAQASSPAVQLVNPALYYYNDGTANYTAVGAGYPLDVWYGYWIQLMAPCTIEYVHP